MGDMAALPTCCDFRGQFGLTALHLAAACGTGELIASLAAGGCSLSSGLEADLDTLASSSSSRGSPPVPVPHRPSTAQHAKVQSALGALFRRGRPPQPPQHAGLAPAAAASPANPSSRASPTACGAGGAAGAEAAVAEMPASGVALPRGSERAFRKGASPLHIACYLGRPEAVAALLQAGAPPDQPDAEGWTPLHYCTGQAPGLQLSHFAAPCAEAAALLVCAGANCFASYHGCLGKPSPWPMALLCSNPVVADDVFERRWDATAAVCRALLDIFVEADAQQQGRASTGASSSTGSSSTNSGGSNGAAATLCDAAAAPAPGDSAAQRCQALLRVRLPASGEECWCVVAAAAKYGHIEAWRDFKERGVGSSHRAPPSFSLGLSHQEDDPSNLWHLASAGVDIAACAATWRSSYGGLGFAVERGHVLTAEALLDLGVPIRDEDIYACLTALCPQPAALRLLLQRCAAAVEAAAGPPVAAAAAAAAGTAVAAEGDPLHGDPQHTWARPNPPSPSAQPSPSPSHAHPPSPSSLVSKFGFSRHLAIKVRGRYEYRAGSSVLFEDEPVRWHCPIHRLLERQLELVGFAGDAKRAQQGQAPAPCWLQEFQRRAAQCMEVMAELGVQPLTYEPHLAPGAVLVRPLSAEELSVYRDPLQNPSQFDLDGSNRYLWLAFESPPWQPQRHHRWPPAFRGAVRVLLLVASKRAQARVGTADTTGIAWKPSTVDSSDSLALCSLCREGPLVSQHSSRQQAAGVAAGREHEEDTEVPEASQAGLASLPCEVLLRVVELAARPVSAWL